MADRLYPIKLAEIESWRRKTGIGLDEGRKRYIQFVILDSIGLSSLRNMLAFKGGNALRFVYGNPRSTKDLDFTAFEGFPNDEREIRRLFDQALKIGANRAGVKMRCQRIARLPNRLGATRPTYEIKVAYQFPNDKHFLDFDSWEKHLSTVVPVEVSVNDVVCETSKRHLTQDSASVIQVCVVEDILAEKLRALLQQPIRNRLREQDVYDIARISQVEAEQIDLTKVSEYFKKKARARGIEPRKSSFNREVRCRASQEYGHLFADLDPDFIPFEKAWDVIVAFVNRLDLPQ